MCFWGVFFFCFFALERGKTGGFFFRAEPSKAGGDIPSPLCWRALAKGTAWWANGRVCRKMRHHHRGQRDGVGGFLLCNTTTTTTITERATTKQYNSPSSPPPHVRPSSGLNPRVPPAFPSCHVTDTRPFFSLLEPHAHCIWNFLPGSLRRTNRIRAPSLHMTTATHKEGSPHGTLCHTQHKHP